MANRFEVIGAAGHNTDEAGRLKVEPHGQARGTTSVALRLASLALDDPSIFRRNPERVAPGHGRRPSRGVDIDAADKDLHGGQS